MEDSLTSHREALAAQRVAVRSTGSPGVTVYKDVQVPCLLTDNLDELRALVARELKGLRHGRRRLDRTRSGSYYENNCTAAAAATALGLHKNTVRYRLDQAEAALLGRSVDQRRLPTELALIALESYGAAVLPNP